MKYFPTEFVFNQEKVLKVVYTGDQNKPTPYFYAPSIEELLGVSNPSANATSRMASLESRILNYNEQQGVTFTSYDVKLLGSSKPAWMHLSDEFYEILAVKTSNNLRARTMYYYNKASMFYIINTSKTDIANVLQHWVNGVVLSTISDTEEFIMHRKEGIGLRKQLTDTIKDAIANNELTDSAYPAITDAVYFIRFGLHTLDLRRILQLRDGENIREHLSKDDLDALGCIEGAIANAIDYGMPLEQALNSERIIRKYRRSPKI